MKNCSWKRCNRDITGGAVAVQAVMLGKGADENRMSANGKKLYYCSLACAASELNTTPPTKALAKIKEMPE